MATAFSSSRGSGVLLFDEDFDMPPPMAPPPEPEIIEPLFTLVELTAAREEAAAESRAAALAEARADAITSAGRALSGIAEHLAAARAEAAAIAEQSSEAVTRLLLGCFALAFPALSERHGPREVAAVLRQVLPALHREPKITVRVSPHIAEAVTREIETLDADIAHHVRLVPTDAIANGDVRVTWEHGAATRDTTALWNQIEKLLTQAGLLDTAGSPLADQTVKEHELVE